MNKVSIWAIIGAILLLNLFACGGGGGGGSTNPTTYIITGTVTDSGSPLQSVTMTLSGSSSQTGTTDSTGKYSFTGLANGNYTVTPTKSGYTFNPVSSAKTVNGTDVTGVDYSGTVSTAATYGISGTVTSSGIGVQGVTMTLGGAGSGSVSTDANGNYMFTGLANGSYTITPSKTGYTFSPNNCSVTVNGANVTGTNFTGTANTYSISGTVTVSSAGLAGVTMSLSGTSAATTTTDFSGNYSFTGLVNGGYTVTPGKTGYTFSPTNSAQTVNGANNTAVNFTATATLTNYSLSDLSGTWSGKSIASRPGAPWWERSTITFDSSGNFTGSATESDGSNGSVQGTMGISTDGIVTLSGHGSFQCSMDTGRTVLICTDTWTAGNPSTAEMKIFTKNAVAYSQSELTGEWNMNQLSTGSSSGSRHWLQCSMALNSAGTGTANINSDNKTYAALPVTMTSDTNGVITISLIDSSATYTTSNCSMDAGKTVIACVEIDTAHNESILTVVTKKTLIYSQSDMTGTWAVNAFADGEGSPWWERGHITVDTNGALSGSLAAYGTTPADIVTGILNLSATGVTTSPFKPLTNCSMDSDKTVMVCTGDWSSAQLTSEMAIWIKR